MAKDYVEQRQYFTINRARQYGKTTTLFLRERKLRKDYLVLSLSFEAAGGCSLKKNYDMEG